MAFHLLSQSEKQIIREAIIAVLVSPYIHPEEYHARFGLDHDSARKVLKRWPNLDDVTNQDDSLLIGGCLNEVSNGLVFTDDLGFSDNDWALWFSVSREEIKRLFDKWRGLRQKRSDAGSTAR